MSNMSYCRFQNTVKDLEDCRNALDELLDGRGALSEDELRASKRLCRLAWEIVDSLVSITGEDFDALTSEHIAEALDDANESASRA